MQFDFCRNSRQRAFLSAIAIQIIFQPYTKPFNCCSSCPAAATCIVFGMLSMEHMTSRGSFIRIESFPAVHHCYRFQSRWTCYSLHHCCSWWLALAVRCRRFQTAFKRFFMPAIIPERFAQMQAFKCLQPKRQNGKFQSIWQVVGRIQWIMTPWNSGNPCRCSPCMTSLQLLPIAKVGYKCPSENPQSWYNRSCNKNKIMV